MFMKILKGLGVALLVIIGFFILIGIWTGYKSSEYEKTAIPYMNVAIKDISNWQIDTIKSYLTENVRDNLSDADSQKMINILSKMGSLIEVGEYQFTNVSTQSVLGGESGTYVSYIVPAKYENGDATITITLKEVGDSFQVYSFNLDSLALFE